MNKYSGLNLNQDKATKPQTVQIVRQGEATPYWFKVNPLSCCPVQTDLWKQDRFQIRETASGRRYGKPYILDVKDVF